MLSKIIQPIFTFCRLCGFDLYALLMRTRACYNWRCACPGPATAPQESVCLAVELNFVQSFAQVGRDFIHKIALTDIPFHVYDLSVPIANQRRMSPDKYACYMKYVSQKIIEPNIIFFNPVPVVTDNRNNASILFWEFESGLLERGIKINPQGHYIVFSDFCLNFYKKLQPDAHIRKIRYPCVAERWQRHIPREIVRGKFKLPQDAFTVFFHFDAASCCERKNPEGVLRAFSAGLIDKPDARLVIKTMNYQPDSAYAKRFDELVTCLGVVGRVRLVNDCMPYQELLDLIAASDVYISLHRGEGLGLGMMEAMALGVPVVCTNYGGNTDFTLPDTAFLVGYKMIPAHTDHAVYKHVKDWPEPDVDEAARHLRAIYEDHSIGTAKAAAATRFLNEHFSTENFEKDVRAFLSELK